MQAQIERADEPPRLTPREQQQVAQWKRTKREDRAVEKAAQEILETAALPDNPPTFRYVWTKSKEGTGFSQQWMPMDQWKKERGDKFKLLAKAAKLTTGFGVGAGAGAKVFGAGIAGVAKQTDGRPMVLSQDDPTATQVEPGQRVGREMRPSEECYHCRQLGHWKRDCPMLKPDDNSRKYQPDAEKKVELDKENLEPFRRRARQLSAPLPPKLRGARGEEAEAATQRIQKIQRGRQARNELNAKKAAAVQIQAIQRGKLARSQLQHMDKVEPELEMIPELEVADEIISTVIDFAVVSAYDDMVETAIAGVIDGSRKVSTLAPESGNQQHPEPEPELPCRDEVVSRSAETLDSDRQSQSQHMPTPPPNSPQSEVTGSSNGNKISGQSFVQAGPGTGRRTGLVRGQTSYLSDASRVPGQRATAYGPSARVAAVAPSTHGLWPATEAAEMNTGRVQRDHPDFRPKSSNVTSTAAAARTAQAISSQDRGRHVKFRGDEEASTPCSARRKQGSQAKWREHIPGPGGVRQMPGNKNHGSLSWDAPTPNVC